MSQETNVFCDLQENKWNSQVTVFREINQTLKDDLICPLSKVEAGILKKDDLAVVEGQLGKGEGLGTIRQSSGEGRCGQGIIHMYRNVTVVPAHDMPYVYPIRSIKERIRRKPRVL